MVDLAAPDLIAARASEVLARVEAAGGKLGTVKLIAVTKGFPPEIVLSALQAGLVDVGENYAQDLDEKAKWLIAEQPSIAGPRWHFIGALQRNKVKLLAGRIHVWQSVDRQALIDEIAKRSSADRILIQVNTTEEPQKAGCAPSSAPALVDRGREKGLTVLGLMTIGPTGDFDPRPAFEQLRQLGEQCEVQELSMGMSGDFEAAVSEGSTMIRIGSALFGTRPNTGRTTGDDR